MKPDGAEVAIVTGAASGIGLAVAERFVKEGRRVAVVDLNRERGEAVAADLDKGEGRAAFFQCDVADPAAVRATVNAVWQRWGRIDVLVNCAGIAGRSAPTWELRDDEWEQIVGINLSGTFYFCRAVLPFMRRAGYGRIVNVASIAGKEGVKSNFVCRIRPDSQAVIGWLTSG